MTSMAIASLALLAALVAAPAAPGQVPAARARIEDLPEEPPASMRLRVEIDGRPRVLLLERTSLRAPGFRLLVQGADGALREEAPPSGRTYRGRVMDETGMVETGLLAAASLLPEGLQARIAGADGPGWSIRPLRRLERSAERAWHEVLEEAGEEELPCGSDRLGSEEPPVLLPVPAERGGGGGVPGADCTLKAADVAFDSDYDFFARKAESSTDTAMAIVEAGLNATNLIYIRDLKVVHRLSTVVLRTDPATDFYAQFPDASDFGAMLSAFRTEWNANMGQVVRDTAYLLTGKPQPELGGLAYVGVMCTNFAYGMGIGGWGYEGIFRHELGHNWGAGHSCGAERRFIMCGNAISAISAHNVRVMSAHRDSRSCLDTVPHPDGDAPPYVRLDRVVLLAGDGPVAIDAVAGDTDPDCVAPRLVSHDARSAFGAAVIPLAPSAPGGPDALLYAPRADLVGTDHFRYAVVDGTGNRSEGSVLVEFRPRGLVSWLKLDETEGEDAADSGALDHGGELRGGLSFATDSVPGRHGGALRFPGTDGRYVSLGEDADFDLPRGLTAALWFRFDAMGAAGGEILVGKGSGWRLARDGTRPSLKFSCAGVALAGGAPGEVRGARRIDDGAWHHAAAVYDGSALALYIDGELDAAVPASGLVLRNSDTVRIGDDLFQGAADELRLYNHGLGADAVRALFDGARVEGAEPPEGKPGVAPRADLSWQAAPDATAYEVYLGTDAAEVAAAAPGSPAHRGRVSGTIHAPRLEPDTRYAWRVDPVVAGAARRGDVRTFTTAFAWTDFDEPPAGASSFTPGAAHRELGFRTLTTPTGGENPLAGTIATTSTPTSPVFSHRSLRATTTIGPVELASRPGAAVSFLLQARSTSYEEEADRVEVKAALGAEEVLVLLLEGGNSLTQRAGDGYGSHCALLPEGWERASLSITTSSDSTEGSERYDFDQVTFHCRRPARLLAHTHFAEPPAGASSHTPGAAGKELGFRTTSTALGSSPRAAVVEAGTAVSSRLLEHRSVRATTTFDAVDLSDAEAVRVVVALRVLSTAYEAADTLSLVLSDGARTARLLQAQGGGGLDGLAGDFHSFWADLPAGWGRTTLTIASASDSSAGAEAYQVRLVEFLSRPAPGPCAEEPPPETRLRRGDANGDAGLDLSDGIRVLEFLFLGGPAPGCLDAADADDSGALDLSDGIAVFNFLFLGAAPPPPPGHLACGPDPSEDPLACAETPCPKT